ncbi:MAG TPA: CDP-diacylglycerol--glycerol-3-phosphate 3-phosphatidyltransferase [Ktedonobacterales bacterium]|nr:CDP-diacylglycerol--glycerol-3-phosphate 3-phosphatidyltransferase [Ktedonobacterales bacterium]
MHILQKMRGSRRTDEMVTEAVLPDAAGPCKAYNASSTLITRSFDQPHGAQRGDYEKETRMKYLPNALSMGRLLATVPLVILVLLDQPAAYLVATALFVLASITDTFDGRLARRYDLVSPLGVFLDLTADKVFVSAVLIALVQVDLVPAWIPIIIITREFIVQGMRSLAAAQGVVIPAGRWGKQKTLITLIAIGGLLLARGLGGATAFPLGLSTGTAPTSFPDYLLALSDVALLLAVVWTIFSAVEYMREGWGVIANPVVTSR